MAKPLIAIDDILDGALALLAEEGHEHLSVRRLAARLHCSPNTLYQQVGKRDELIRALIERHFASIDRDFSGKDSWQASAMAWCDAVRQLLLSNPPLMSLMDVEHRDLILDDVNALLDILLQHGLDKSLALRVCRVLTHLVFGLCATELKTPADYHQQRGRRRTSIDGADLISTHGAGRDGAPEVFQQAVRWTIAGIERDTAV